ncbi:uroporphyrin-III C-methyltransferase [Lentinula detonsa]|uniref:precorrin-2 dehydrogenase n=1 Tax=Lentinula detonsa TaxID=2804962 RepID=A0A9W8U378_9AGAR|nr:uroporphyrin-III C-methyltransferase [Lentinula detonsa]
MISPSPSPSNLVTGGFPTPHPGVSLLLSFSFSKPSCLNSQPAPFYILGSGPLAAQRAFAALEADASVVILGKGGLENACEELRWRVNHRQVDWVDLDNAMGYHNITLDAPKSDMDDDALALDNYFSNLPSSVIPKFLCITDTLLSTATRRSRASAISIYTLCHARNMSVNTTDYSDLCDFSFATTYRFPDSLASPSSHSTFPSFTQVNTSGGALQIAVTTNGQGCRLASRIKREIVTRLPRNLGQAVGNVGRMRAIAKERDQNPNLAQTSSSTNISVAEELGEIDPCVDTETASTPNLPVPQRPSRTHSSTKADSLDIGNESVAERTRRRMKWVAQISEYWPFEKLAAMTERDMKRYLEDECNKFPIPPVLPPTSIHSIFPSPPAKPGQILLIGSGPGHPSLLTVAAHRALTELADIVLADKLVPAAVLELIPSKVEVVIARKFPGNADRAQQEMMERAVKEARKGKCVVRLKQGDPAIYGRFGEEMLYFRNPPPFSPSTADFPPLPPTLVIPGVSSALAAPTMFDIPCTQRGASTSFLITTPVGKGGKALEMPKYERARTVVILMGVARLGSVVKALIASGKDDGDYPSHLPIAIIERASMPDQRVVESTLEDIECAMESAEVGAQRPPGMMVVGWSVPALWGDGNVNVLDGGSDDTAEDIERVRNWLGNGVRWRVREGLAPAWDMFNINI